MSPLLARQVLFYALLGFFCAASIPVAAQTQTSNVADAFAATNTEVAQSPEIDFGEEGDVIFRVFLRDILLTDGLFSIMRNGNVYLPLAELSALLDFPIVVDAVTGKANGWYLKPGNTFDLNSMTGTVDTADQTYSFTDSDVFADDIDLFVDAVLLQQWLPLIFDISLSAQVLTVRSNETLAKESARERANRSVEKDVTYAATRDYDVPAYRLLDWPEVSVRLGGAYSPESEDAFYDYSLRAVGDFAFMNGKVGLSGSQNTITGASLTLGRSNPQGMFGPLRIADFELGDTSQFLPGMIGSSLSGRGVRFGNTRLADRRDLDTIDLQGEQQADYEVELYVNDRFQVVDRDSSDNVYDFQDVPLQLGQNEIRLEFYGPQGQRFTETRRSFVGGGQGRQGRFDYEFALVEPGQRVFDLFDEVEEARDGGELFDVRLSTAMNLSYGLSRRTSVGLTVASLATDTGDEESESTSTENKLYANARLSTDVAGVLLSSDLTVDPNGKVAGSASARTSVGDYELGLSQRLFQKDFRNTGTINTEDTGDLSRLASSASISRQFFRVPGGRVSYGANASYQQKHSGDASASLTTRMDYQTSYVGLSWSQSNQRDLAANNSSLAGRIAARFNAGDYTPWSISSDLSYSDAGDRKIKSGSLRLARPLSGSGHLSLAASRDLQVSSTAYSAAWSRQFKPFRLNTTIAGTSSEDVSFRVGLEMTARRYPSRWLPAISSSGGSAAIAVMVFGDDNQNGKHDESEPVLEGVRLTRNGLMAGTATDSNGVALLTGLSSGSSVDIGILESDITDPSLKFNGIEQGILPRPGRIPVIPVALQRATDLEGTVMVSGTSPAPNVRMVLTPVGEKGEPMEIHTEYDGYYYLSHVPLGVYDFGPDPQQLEAAGLVANPLTRRVVLENLDDFPPPEDFNLIRLADLDPDDDDDGVPDVADAFPLDPEESVDTDDDGIGNNADTDDDADGVTDSEDAFPLDATETIDTDGDGTGDNADTDDDGDGVGDRRDAYPLDASESFDTDGDGIGNNKDRDDDGDKVKDRYDAFPLDASESTDADLDGIGDNADKDDDNDTVADTADLCPATNIPELMVPAEKLSGGRYAMIENTGSFTSSNQRKMTLRDTGGCSCEQILSIKKQSAKNFIAKARSGLHQAINNHTPRLGAALQQLEGNELIHGCRRSTLRKWSGQVAGE